MILLKVITAKDTRPIRVDDEVYTKILAKKLEMEKTQNKIVSLNDALKELLG